MNTVLKTIKLSLALATLLAVLIVLPAALFGVVKHWQVIFLSLSYLFFFLGSVWRILSYGELVQRDRDQQVKSLSGRLASIVLAIGLLGVHWFALFDFSHLVDSNSASNLIWDALAALLILAAAGINQIAIRTLGEFFDRLTIKTDHQLVQNGIYSVVRHPIYLSYILLFAGFCLMLKSIISLGLLGVVCAIWFGSRIAIEEEMLGNQFEDEYRDYQKRTKRLFPFVY